MAKKKEAQTKRPSVVYRDIATGKIYTTMPKGYIRYSDLDAKGKRAADEIQNEAFPYNALSNYGSEGVVVYPNRQTLEDADTSWHLADPTETDKNMFHRANVAAEDKRVARSTNFEAALNFMSPTTYIGALFDAAQGKKSFMDSMLDGNSGIVTDKFQEEHPYLSMGANFLGDLITGGLIDKALKGAVSLSRVKPINIADDVVLASSSRNNSSALTKVMNNIYTKILKRPAPGTLVDSNTVLTPEQIEQINKFMSEDVKPRFIQSLNDEGVSITDPINETINMKFPDKVRITNSSSTLNASFNPSTGEIQIPVNKIKKSDLETTMVHELEHKQRDDLFKLVNEQPNIKRKRYMSANNQKGKGKGADHPYNIQKEYSAYSPKENEALNDAYKFSHSIPFDPTSEKGAVNRQIRYNLYKATGKVGKELDDYIDNLNWIRLGRNLGYDGYIESFMPNFIRHPNISLNNIKHSLKYVPAILGTTLGIGSIGNNIRNEQMR